MKEALTKISLSSAKLSGTSREANVFVLTIKYLSNICDDICGVSIIADMTKRDGVRSVIK